MGKTEEELKEGSVKYKKGSFPFQANSRARANGSTEGFGKGELYSAHMLMILFSSDRTFLLRI